jgi:hypothetical protein
MKKALRSGRFFHLEHPPPACRFHLLEVIPLQCRGLPHASDAHVRSRNATPAITA